MIRTRRGSRSERKTPVGDKPGVSTRQRSASAASADRRTRGTRSASIAATAAATATTPAAAALPAATEVQGMASAAANTRSARRAPKCVVRSTPGGDASTTRRKRRASDASRTTRASQSSPDLEQQQQSERAQREEARRKRQARPLAPQPAKRKKKDRARKQQPIKSEAAKASEDRATGVAQAADEGQDEGSELGRDQGSEGAEGKADDPGDESGEQEKEEQAAKVKHEAGVEKKEGATGEGGAGAAEAADEDVEDKDEEHEQHEQQQQQQRRRRPGRQQQFGGQGALDEAEEAIADVLADLTGVAASSVSISMEEQGAVEALAALSLAAEAEPDPKPSRSGKARSGKSGKTTKSARLSTKSNNVKLGSAKAEDSGGRPSGKRSNGGEADPGAKTKRKKYASTLYRFSRRELAVALFSHVACDKNQCRSDPEAFARLILALYELEGWEPAPMQVSVALDFFSLGKDTLIRACELLNVRMTLGRRPNFLGEPLKRGADEAAGKRGKRGLPSLQNGEEDDSDASEDAVFCVCGNENTHELMVECSGGRLARCHGWVHPQCVGVDADDEELLKDYMCPLCQYAAQGKHVDLIAAQGKQRCEPACGFCGSAAEDDALTGDMVGPFLDRDKAPHWCHALCAMASSGVGLTDEGLWYNVSVALRRASEQRCRVCKKWGASVCSKRKGAVTPSFAHLRCVFEQGKNKTVRNVRRQLEGLERVAKGPAAEVAAAQEARSDEQIRLVQEMKASLRYVSAEGDDGSEGTTPGPHDEQERHALEDDARGGRRRQQQQQQQQQQAEELAVAPVLTAA